MRFLCHLLLLLSSVACTTMNKDTTLQPLVVISTPFGEMKAVLFNDTPKHKANFLKLAEEGFYDSLLFHRVINNFMIQGGDPDSKTAASGISLGGGDVDYTLPAEFNSKYYHRKGALAAARQGDEVNPNKESSGAQFYIVDGQKYTEKLLQPYLIDIKQLYKKAIPLLEKPEYASYRNKYVQAQQSGSQAQMIDVLMEMKPMVEKETGLELDKQVPANYASVYQQEGGVPHLDGAYTVFGQVVEGLEVIDAIAKVRTDNNDRPIENIAMQVRVEMVPAYELSESYPVLEQFSQSKQLPESK